jgi:transcriptional regulator with XRE-family HTH domain
MHMTPRMTSLAPVGLAARRRARGLSRERLGAAAGGVSAATIRRTERGETRPHPRTLAALAEALGCRPDDLTDPQHDHDPEASRVAEEVGEVAAQLVSAPASSGRRVLDELGLALLRTFSESTHAIRASNMWYVDNDAAADSPRKPQLLLGWPRLLVAGLVADGAYAPLLGRRRGVSLPIAAGYCVRLSRRVWSCAPSAPRTNRGSSRRLVESGPAL